MSAAEWFAGSNTPPKKLDLKPEDMETRTRTFLKPYIHYNYNSLSYFNYINYLLFTLLFDCDYYIVYLFT